VHYAIENLVLPVLSDFAPEVVINSAGQDNHYSDPLAHMRVSAQGYARLNEMLAPDLAVLEGGYSIQSALPYVNLAIILAMAGLDYSHVREPDYDPARLVQSQAGWDSIRHAVDLLRAVWGQPEEVYARLYPRLGETHTREKEIYYDTDGIREQQQETVRVCDDRLAAHRLAGAGRTFRAAAHLGHVDPVGGVRPLRRGGARPVPRRRAQAQGAVRLGLPPGLRRRPLPALGSGARTRNRGVNQKRGLSGFDGHDCNNRDHYCPGSSPWLRQAMLSTVTRRRTNALVIVTSLHQSPHTFCSRQAPKSEASPLKWSVIPRFLAHSLSC